MSFHDLNLPKTFQQRDTSKNYLGAQTWATAAALRRAPSEKPLWVSVSRCGPAVPLCQWESSQGQPPKALTGEASRHRTVENSPWIGRSPAESQLLSENRKI
jgi:hypothetical protein